MNISDLPVSPFGQPLAQTGPTLPPLSQQRVSAALQRMEINHGLDEDGDSVATWENVLVHFLCTGDALEVFQVRIMWAAMPPAQERTRMLEWINTWHDTHRWPRVFLHTEGDTTFLFADVATDLEHGVTDPQLEQLIRCGVATGLALVEDLQAAFPEHTDWLPMQDPTQMGEQA